MPEPDYKRPFEQTDFRGYFEWSAHLTEKLGGSLYHACHKDELRDCLAENKLGLRSSWKLNLPEHGEYQCPGVWTGLNFYNDGNKYGPLLMEFPLKVLNGRHFVAFRRESEGDRPRYFFVQYEARVPIYSFGTEDTDARRSWRKIDPATYFDSYKNGLTLKDTAIYDIVLTHPLSLDAVKIRGVDHPTCIPKKCGGSDLMKNMDLAAKIGLEHIAAWMQESPEYKGLLSRFPDATGETIELKRVGRPKA